MKAATDAIYYTGCFAIGWHAASGDINTKTALKLWFALLIVSSAAKQAFP